MTIPSETNAARRRRKAAERARKRIQQRDRLPVHADPDLFRLFADAYNLDEMVAEGIVKNMLDGLINDPESCTKDVLRCLEWLGYPGDLTAAHVNALHDTDRVLQFRAAVADLIGDSQ